MLKLFEILTYIGAAIGVVLMAGTFGDSSAPQEAALAAMALGFVVIPYCVASTLHRRSQRD